MATVKLTNVKKIYGKDTVAVQDFNLDIADKEFIVFVGPSGCGKSTLIRLLLRFYDCNSGIVRINGKDVRCYTKEELSSMFGVVFQNDFIYADTIEENSDALDDSKKGTREY